MRVCELDSNNFYIGYTELTEENKDTLNYTTVPIMIGCYKPRFNHNINVWEEGATSEEIEQIEQEQEANRPPQEPSQMEVRLGQIEEAVGMLATQVAKNTLLNGGLK